MTLPVAIPSPPVAEWQIGPFALRAYAIAIIIGIIVAGWIFYRRYVARGGPGERVIDLVLWMVPFGIVGGRLYHVISSPDAYFGPNGDPVRALYIWQGGLGIWGAIALGALGAVIGARRYGLRMAPIMDAIAPALLVAQAIGRLGNWFNQELYGAPTTLPWGLQIDEAHLVGDFPPGTLFHPTFLYEMLWNLAAAGFLIWAERRFRLHHGRLFALYVMAYTAGRVWIEMLRIDDAEMVLGLRLNVWTSILVFLAATIVFLWIGRVTSPDDPDPIYRPGREPAEADPTATGDGGEETADDGASSGQAEAAGTATGDPGDGGHDDPAAPEAAAPDGDTHP